MTGADRPAPGWWPAAAVAALAVAIAVTHGAGLTTPLHYDDKVEILANPSLHGWGQWLDIYTYNPFRFLLLATFAVQVNTTGTEPTWPLHLVNLIIHLANAALLTTLATGVLRRLGPRGVRSGWPLRLAALATGSLFAVHPLLVEGVTYVSGRSSSLATTWYLAGFVVLDRLLAAEASQPARSARWRVTVGRLGLVATLAVAAAWTGSALGLWLSRADLVTRSQAWPATAAITGALLVPCGVLAWRLLRRPLPDGPRAWGWTLRWLLLGLLFLAGALTKEIVVTFPVGLWLWELCMVRGGRIGPALRHASGFYLPFLAGPTAMAAFRVVYYGELLPPDAIVRPPLVNLWTQAEVIWRYLGLFAWPDGLSIYHHHPVSGGPLTWPTAAALLLGAAVVSGAVWALRRQPALSFVALWSLVALAPSSSLIPLKETMAEHRAYLPAAAWCLAPMLVAGLVPRLREHPWAPTALLGVLCLLYGVRTATYTRLWASEEALWTRAVELAPDAAAAWYMLGDVARLDQRLFDAEARYRRCLEIDPTYEDAAINLGLVFAERSEPAAALRWFETAAEIARAEGRCPAAALNDMAALLTRRGQLEEAARRYRQVLDPGCAPDDYIAHVGLGRLYEGGLGDPERAVDHYRAAVRAHPGHPDNAGLERRIRELSW